MFPYKITKLEGNDGKELLELFKGQKEGFVQVGPKKWTLPAMYADHAEKYYSFDLKEDDLWVMTYPRSGSTWMQELIWLVNNKLDYDTASKIPIYQRFPFFESSVQLNDSYIEEVVELNDNDIERIEKLRKCFFTGHKIAQTMKTSRHFKTHLPPSLMPPNLLDTCKVVYLARNPFDVAVSFYHLNKLVKLYDYQSDFEKYWELFEKDLILYSPYWEHIKEGWEKRNHPNLLFLFYEDLLRDLHGNIRKICTFLNKQMTDDEIKCLADHLHIDNFRKMSIFFMEEKNEIKGLFNQQAQQFIRRGKIGGNEEFGDDKIKLRAEKWFKENLAKTDIVFPEF